MDGAAATLDFARLFMVPGMDHCAGGKGAYAINYMRALEDWVERGQAPDVLEVVAQANAPPFAAMASRPLCRWPAWPRYRGSGAANAAASFECVNR